ncbi:MAG: PQQ-like beta-propeller repeat protein [Thermoanaerobaculia bacterium]|nr:PQQ-like beta-propeller repeat protein [Thermoanaerobaculia bacterium]
MTRPASNPYLRLAALALALVSVSFAGSVTATDSGQGPIDWPQFRGPEGDGIHPADAFPSEWPDGGLEVAWKIALGKGFSGVSAVDGVLYTQYSREGEEYLAAYDAATGDQKWKLRLDRERPDQFGDGPRSTPTIDGNLIFAVSALGNLWAANRASGEQVWNVDLAKEYGAKIPTWGVSAAPVVVDDLLLFNVGGRDGYLLAGFDKSTGELKWHGGSGKPGYSLPLTITVGGIRQTIFFAGDKVVSVDPASGAEHWSHPWSTAYDVNAAAPVFVPPDRLYISSGYDTGASLFRLSAKDGKAAAEVVWSSRRMKNQFSSSVYYDGHIYGFDNRSLKCIVAETGEDVWRKSGFNHGSLFLVDGHLVVLGEKGKLALVEATSTSYVEKSLFQAAKGKHWTVPTLYGDLLYVRNELELIAFKLPKS